MAEKQQDRVTISGLTPDEVNLIKDAARYCRMTIRDYVLAQSASTMKVAASQLGVTYVGPIQTEDTP